MFQIGQQVVCVKGFIPELMHPACLKAHPRLPKDNEIFTIRDIQNLWGGKFLGLCFEEIISSTIGNNTWEQAFSATHFKPIRKTDISIFESMLKSVKADQKDLIDA
jgi:hypothetical protein